MIQSAAEQPLHETLHHAGGQAGEQKRLFDVGIASVTVAGCRDRIDGAGNQRRAFDGGGFVRVGRLRLTEKGPSAIGQHRPAGLVFD